MAKRNALDTDVLFTVDDVIKLLDRVPLNPNELRKAIRPTSQYLYQKINNAVGTKWGVRTGRMKEQGVKLQVARKSESSGGKSADYRIYFSLKSSRVKGTKDYIAPLYVARWLEGGTKPHYTARFATRAKARRGKLILTAHQRKLKHPGFAGRPAVHDVVESERSNVENISRNNIMYQLKKKGVEDA